MDEVAIKSAAKLMALLAKTGEKLLRQPLSYCRKIMSSSRWTKEQTKLAFHLYCQIPFGKIDGRNKEIIALAKNIGRTADAVAMKMLNIASLDPAITSTGRSGLGNASSLDREVWEEFHADWEGLAMECSILLEKLHKGSDEPAKTSVVDEPFDLTDFTGETRQVLTEQRIKQSFFRRTMLASYRGRCCMSGLAEPRLLIASHIVPWGKSKENRLNPSNGLCLSALHDKAFDKGLITLTDDLKIVISDELKRRDDTFVKTVLIPLNGRAIEPPQRFSPELTFIAWHRNELFVDNRK